MNKGTAFRSNPLILFQRSNMSNTISERVADFLGNYPPFNEMHNKDLLLLAEEVSIVYKEKGAIVFKENDKQHPHFYVVHKGAVELLRNSGKDIVDICDEGDIFGLRPLMAREKYKMDAICYEESILYAIPIDKFQPFINAYEELGNFLISSFASNTANPYAIESLGNRSRNISDHSPIDPRNSLLDLQPLRYSKKLVSCSSDTSAREIASLMSKKKVGSILVMDKERPVGIITDKDLRDQVVSGAHTIEVPAAVIMTTPVITYPKKLSIAQAQMAMTKNNISHLCLTEDGTTKSRAVAVVSKQDVMVALGNNPSVLVRAISQSSKIKQLKPLVKSISLLLKDYLENNIPMSIIMQTIGELNDACIKQVLKIVLTKRKIPPPVPFTWLTMGSLGRGEQLLQTDQDNALIFSNVNADKYKEVKSYFLDFSAKVNKALNDLGFEYCPAEMMASNSKWCLSLNEWKDLTSRWISNPGSDEVLLSSIFYDYNPTYGDPILVDQLTEHIYQRIAENPNFLIHLASGALQNPSPTGFFRQFLLEEDGKYKDFFDLKRRAIMPLTDAARVLVLSHQISSINNTALRFQKLAELEPNNKDLFLSCSYAIKALLKFRTRQGIKNRDSGRYVDLTDLDKRQKMKLKKTFRTIKEIQEILALRFKVPNTMSR